MIFRQAWELTIGDHVILPRKGYPPDEYRVKRTEGDPIMGRIIISVEPIQRMILEGPVVRVLRLRRTDMVEFMPTVKRSEQEHEVES